MKIKEITYEHILFDNGSKITFDHDQDCCEWNYADFEQLNDTVALDYDFDEAIRFEMVEEKGFRFGDAKQMFFVPCYSEQNGYYRSDIDIYYNGNHILTLLCEEHLR